MHPRCYHHDRRRDDRVHHRGDRGHLHRGLHREHHRDAGNQHLRDVRRDRRYATGTERWDDRGHRGDLRHQRERLCLDRRGVIPPGQQALPFRHR